MLQKINWSAISPDESEKLKNELVEVWEASVRSTRDRGVQHNGNAQGIRRQQQP